MAVVTENYPKTEASYNQKSDIQTVPVGADDQWFDAGDANDLAGPLKAIQRAIRLQAVIAAIAPVDSGINGKAFRFDSIDATSGLARANTDIAADLDKRFTAAIEKIEQGGDLDGTATAGGLFGVQAGVLTMASGAFATGTLLGLSSAGGIVTYAAGKFGPIGNAIDATTMYVDLSVLRNPADNVSIQYDANGELVILPAGIDHGGLGGLGDDDHPQYSLADGTRAFTGTVGGITPAAASDLATKGYIDNLVDGKDWKESVRAATTAALTLASDFENGDTIDAVVLATGDRILLKNQAAGIENGIYVVNASGAPTRAIDYAVAATVASTVVLVEEGTANSDFAFQCTNDIGTDVVGTDALVYTQFNPGESNTASNQGVGGVGVFDNKNGVDLEFRNIIAASGKITVALDAGNKEIDIDAVPDEAEFILAGRVFS